MISTSINGSKKQYRSAQKNNKLASFQNKKRTDNVIVLKISELLKAGNKMQMN